jgi:hypothetical protein
VFPRGFTGTMVTGTTHVYTLHPVHTMEQNYT